MKPQPAEQALVVLRFATQKNARWTSIFGMEQATAMNSVPFLALSAPCKEFFSVEETSEGLPNERFIFLISTQKPRGLLSDFYVAISPARDEETRVVIVDPPLALAGCEELFIYTAPVPDFALISEPLEEGDGVSGNGVEPFQHRLDEVSYSKFSQYAKEDLYKFNHLFDTNPALAPQFTEDEEYGLGWSSWNGTRKTDSGLKRPLWLYFDKVPFAHLNLAEPPKLFLELGLYQQ